MVGAAGGTPPKPMGQDTAYKFEGLQAGMLVEAQVSGVLGDGLRMVFLGYFEATVACDVLGMPHADWPKRFKHGAKATARILFVHPQTKTVGLGLCSHLATCQAYEPPMSIGARVHVNVQNVLNHAGALVLTAPTAEAAEAGSGALGALGGWMPRTEITDLQPRQTAEDALKTLRAGSVSKGVVVGVFVTITGVGPSVGLVVGLHETWGVTVG